MQPGQIGDAISFIHRSWLSTCRRHTAAYRRHGPLLRMLLLCWAYAMPVLASRDAMHAFSPAPSTVCALPALSASAFLLARSIPAYQHHRATLHPLLILPDRAPAPHTCQQVPYLRGVVDAYSLWLSTRNAFLAWAVLGCRPPLYLALPFQLLGLWRITAADFCQSQVWAHLSAARRRSLSQQSSRMPAHQPILPCSALVPCRWPPGMPT